MTAEEPFLFKSAKCFLFSIGLMHGHESHNAGAAHVESDVLDHQLFSLSHSIQFHRMPMGVFSLDLLMNLTAFELSYLIYSFVFNYVETFFFLMS